MTKKGERKGGEAPGKKKGIMRNTYQMEKRHQL